jgi:hypothetical protein
LAGLAGKIEGPAFKGRDVVHDCCYRGGATSSSCARPNRRASGRGHGSDKPCQHLLNEDVEVRGRSYFFNVVFIAFFAEPSTVVWLLCHGFLLNLLVFFKGDFFFFLSGAGEIKIK